MTTPAVTIAALQPERWRCGVCHTPAPVDWPAGRWSEDELEELKADPRLAVAVHGEAEKAEQPPATPTVQAALETALKALDHATPDEISAFAGAIYGQSFSAAAFEGVRDSLEWVKEAREREATTPEDAIAGAVAALKVGRSPASWTRDDLPRVEAIEAIVGFDITAAQRDAACKDAGDGD